MCTDWDKGQQLSGSLTAAYATINLTFHMYDHSHYFIVVTLGVVVVVVGGGEYTLVTHISHMLTLCC